MNIIIASIARAGGVEVPVGQLPFSRRVEAAAPDAEARAPGLLRVVFGHLFRRLGQAALAFGERLLAAPAREGWRPADCR